MRILELILWLMAEVLISLLEADMSDWILDDVEILARENPSSFFIPSETERRSQRIGDLVRLHFKLTEPKDEEPDAERMWVEIASVQSDGNRYEGNLTNQPAFIRDLNLGDIIKFESRHIARTIIKKGDSRWIDCADKAALVSKAVFDGDKTVRWAYREKPDNEKDSGLKAFFGT